MQHPPVELVWPSLARLPRFVDALRRGWAPRNVDGAAAIRAALEEIERAPAGFVARQIDREGRGPPIRLPDGSVMARLPSFTRWIWDGDFCGLIGFRWQPGTPALPPHVLGHIGYTVVPWKRRRGYATAALRRFLDDVRPEGLPYVELTSDPDNLPSQRVITANGGVLVERFTKPSAFGAEPGFRFRIHLDQ